MATPSDDPSSTRARRVYGPEPPPGLNRPSSQSRGNIAVDDDRTVSPVFVDGIDPTTLLESIMDVVGASDSSSSHGDTERNDAPLGEEAPPPVYERHASPGLSRPDADVVPPPPDHLVGNSQGTGPADPYAHHTPGSLLAAGVLAANSKFRYARMKLGLSVIRLQVIAPPRVNNDGVRAISQCVDRLVEFNYTVDEFENDIFGYLVTIREVHGDFARSQEFENWANHFVSNLFAFQVAKERMDAQKRLLLQQLRSEL